MTSTEIKHHFNLSFYEASGHMSPSLFSNTMRWLAIVLVILAVMWSINHFMSMESRTETYLVDFGMRLVKLVLGLTFFILLLTTQGKSP